MRRRLDLAMTLMGDPRIVFLDEPTTGLDPRSRRTMWRIIRDLVAGGATISGDAVPGGGGRARRRDRHPGPGKDRRRRYPDDLKRRIPGGHVRLRFADVNELDSAASSLDGASRDHESLHSQVPTDGDVRSLKSILDRLIDAFDPGREGLPVDAHPDLDDVFFALTDNRDTEKENAR